MVIRLMSSMFTKKQSVKERLQMLPNISLDKLKKELNHHRMQEHVLKEKVVREEFLRERQRACEKLYRKFKHH